MVEHHVANVAVEGSNPFTRSFFIGILLCVAERGFGDLSLGFGVGSLKSSTCQQQGYISHDR